MSRVFAFRRHPSLDFSAAAKFGTLIFITEAVKVNQYKSDEMGEFLQNVFHDYQFDPDKDYLLVAGTNISVAQMFAFVLINYGKVRCLNFNPMDLRYCVNEYAIQDYEYEYEDA